MPDKTRKTPARKPVQLSFVEPEPPAETPARAAKPVAEPPTLPEWRALHAAAARFKELGPWNWLYDSDMFGVKDPETGLVGYCSVMGKLGRHFALAAYLGSKGLAGYLKMLEGAKPRTAAELYELQECLMASFENREYLFAEDRAVIRELGLKFRGANAWPLFRRYRRGYLPWFMSGPEARFLATVLDQAIDVTGRARTEPDLLRRGEDGSYLVRTSRLEAGKPVWQDERLEPVPLTLRELEAESGAVPLPGGYAAKLRRLTATRLGAWEIDIDHFPEPVQDSKGTPPFYPKQLIVADVKSGLIFDVGLAGPDDYVTELRTTFARMVKDLELLPTRVIVQNEMAEAFIGPICRELKIPLERGKLKMVNGLKRDLRMRPGLNNR